MGFEGTKKDGRKACQKSDRDLPAIEVLTGRLTDSACQMRTRRYALPGTGIWRYLEIQLEAHAYSGIDIRLIVVPGKNVVGLVFVLHYDFRAYAN